jgi:hypothetical protein
MSLSPWNKMEFRCARGGGHPRGARPLPPRTTGAFAHFGREYGSPHKSWELQSAYSGQTLLGLWGLAVGAVNLIRDQVLSEVPLLDYVLPECLAYSLADHSPLNYVRTSLMSGPGSEFLP